MYLLISVVSATLLTAFYIHQIRKAYNQGLSRGLTLQLVSMSIKVLEDQDAKDEDQSTNNVSISS